MTGQASLRFVGAGVAAAIAALEAVVALAAFDAPILLAGLPTVTVLGFWLGPLALRSFGGAATLMAVLAVPGSALLVASSLALEPSVVSVPELVAGVLFLALIGVAIFGLPALALTVPSAWLWAVLVRRMADRHLASAPRRPRAGGAAAQLGNSTS